MATEWLTPRSTRLAPCIPRPHSDEDSNRHGLRVRRVLAEPGAGVSAPMTPSRSSASTQGRKEYNQVEALAQLAIVRGPAYPKVILLNVETPLGSPQASQQPSVTDTTNARRRTRESCASVSAISSASSVTSFLFKTTCGALGRCSTSSVSVVSEMLPAALTTLLAEVRGRDRPPTAHPAAAAALCPTSARPAAVAVAKPSPSY